VPVSGAMDSVAHRLANALVGNAPTAATLEVTLLGPELRAERPLVVAVAGATFSLSVDGQAVPHQAAFALAAGATLRFGARQAGSRAYVAVAGGIDTPPVLGSRATHLVSGMGGLAGRALVGGDWLPIGQPPSDAVPRSMRQGGASAATPPASPVHTLRVMLGPQDTWFSPQAIDTLLHAVYRVSIQSNRMGFQLEGPLLTAARAEGPLSEPVPFGALQVPAGGVPILLMADRQTAGGYPKAGQLGPGDVVRFAACTRAEARAALIARERELLRLMPEEPGA
jgi:antagonist of KipI